MAIPNRDILHLLSEANSSLSSEHCLSDLARRAGWSKFHLHREIRRMTGETPKRYVQRVRLQRAAAVLTSSDVPILELALDAGFRSHEVFVRAFRKQFNCSPSHYRKWSSVGKPEAMRKRHESLVRTISPCIRLFYIEEKNRTRSYPMKRPEISRITLEQQPVLFIRRDIDQSLLQPYFAECFGKLFGYGMQNGLAISGNPIARYVAIGPGLWTVDCVLPLSQAADATEEFQAGSLEGGAMLKAKHFGPYEELKDSYVSIQTWMKEEGVTPRAAHWEQYVTDPGQEPDSSKWQTDIYWPI